MLRKRVQLVNSWLVLGHSLNETYNINVISLTSPMAFANLRDHLVLNASTASVRTVQVSVRRVSMRIAHSKMTDLVLQLYKKQQPPL